MYFVKSYMVLLSIIFLGLNGCNSDLAPSGSDQRAVVSSGSIGFQPGQQAPNITWLDSVGNSFNLSDHLVGGATPAQAVVLYFTMWCPICTSHMDDILFNTVPLFSLRGTVVYVAVDYVSGTVAMARTAEVSNGYAGSAFRTVVDTNQTVMNQMHASMGTTVVINQNGLVLMNEDYRTGQNLRTILNAVLP